MHFGITKSYTVKFSNMLLAVLLVSGSSLAEIHTISNSHWSLFTPAPDALEIPPPIVDVYGTLDDTKICSAESCTLYDGMTLATNSTWNGMPLRWYGIRVFTEGTYTFESSGGYTLVVGAGQLGMHGYWEWGPYTEIPMVALWDFFDTFPTTGSQIWNLASMDGDGDGIPGIALFDDSWAFPGFSPNFNLNMDPEFVWAPAVYVAIAISGGNTQECAATGGTTVAMNAQTTLIGGEVLASIEWFIDGASIGFGESLSYFLTLGTHTVDALAMTTSGLEDTDSVDVRVMDRAPPEINAEFVNTRTGDPISMISGNKVHFVTTEFGATDICDPEPTSQGVVTAFEVKSGDTLKVQGKKNTIQLEASTIELSVTGADASGNTSSVKVPLSVAE